MVRAVPPQKSISDLHGYTVMHVAAHACDLDAVRTLIDQGWDINALSERGETPLHAFVWGAARLNEVAEGIHMKERAMVHGLLDLGADPSIVCHYRITAMEAALLTARPDLAELIETFTQRRVLLLQLGGVGGVEQQLQRKI